MKRVLWFSPLPPAKTDIANYSARLLPFLTEHFDLQFCVPDETPHSAFLNARPISNLTNKELNEADLCVYHLGNNARFHGQIFECAIKHPGLIVLHDRAIHEFFLGYLNIWDGKAPEEKISRYLETMGSWYGEQGYIAAEGIFSGNSTPSECAQDYPLFEMACENALAVLCHNPLVSAEVRWRFPLLDVLDLPLPYPSSGQEASQKHDSVEKTMRLVAFGFMSSNRRLIPFMKAWAASPWKDRFHLDIAGEMAEPEQLDMEIQRLGLGRQVLRHGFMEDSALDALLGSADLALNLRFPTMGEASGSQLRIWANRVASLVTDIGWYGQLPEGTVLKIRPQHEHDDILTLLERLEKGDVDLDAIAVAGARQLRHHDPGRYASKLAAWYAEAEERLKRTWYLRREIAGMAAKHAEILPLDAFLPVPDLLYRLSK